MGYYWEDPDDNDKEERKNNQRCYLINASPYGKGEVQKDGVYRPAAKMVEYTRHTSLLDLYYKYSHISPLEAMSTLSDEELQTYEYITSKQFESDLPFICKYLKEGYNVWEFNTFEHSYKPEQFDKRTTQNVERAGMILRKLTEISDDSIGSFAEMNNVVPYFYSIILRIEQTQDKDQAMQTLKKLSNVIFENIYRKVTVSSIEASGLYDDLASFLYDADKMLYIQKHNKESVEIDMLSKHIITILAMISHIGSFYDYSSTIVPQRQPIMMSPLNELKRKAEKYLNKEQYESFLKQVDECKALADSKIAAIIKKYGRKY